MSGACRKQLLSLSSKNILEVRMMQWPVQCSLALAQQSLKYTVTQMQ